ncbi:hypothetical protein [Sulfurovum sp.]|uniref:hypothetical protein n=1 Tax=Sulfurovum sp. TaxID=1969726 RepID=UPI002A369F2B|nr:hypothetical protein [Sulfurovum sp.]
MYSEHVKSLFLTTIGIFTIFFFIDVTISESLMQNFITFLSITFGFYMTSLSVLYNSKYIKKLYDEIDPKKPTQRKIHTLKTYFKNSAYWSLFSIGLLMIYSLITKIENNVLDLNAFFESILVSVVFINFIFMILLFKVFINGLIEESTK